MSQLDEASGCEPLIDQVKDMLNAREVIMHGNPLALWSGQGKLLRQHTDASGHTHVILTFVAPTRRASHPRGWNTRLHLSASGAPTPSNAIGIHTVPIVFFRTLQCS